MLMMFAVFPFLAGSLRHLIHQATSRYELATGRGRETEDEAIARRIKSEYREMPGLRLKVAQAARLWGYDILSVERVLDQHVEQEFLFRSSDGLYSKSNVWVG